LIYKYFKAFSCAQNQSFTTIYTTTSIFCFSEGIFLFFCLWVRVKKVESLETHI